MLHCSERFGMVLVPKQASPRLLAAWFEETHLQLMSTDTIFGCPSAHRGRIKTFEWVELQYSNEQLTSVKENQKALATSCRTNPTSQTLEISYRKIKYSTNIFEQVPKTMMILWGKLLFSYRAHYLNHHIDQNNHSTLQKLFFHHQKAEA